MNARGGPARRSLGSGVHAEVCFPAPEDYDFLVELRNRPDIRRWFGDSRELDPEKSRAWLALRAGRIDDVMLVIRYRPRDLNVGSIGWAHWDAARGTADFGRLAIDPGAMRHLLATGESREKLSGLAYEASRIVRDYAFGELGLRAVTTCYRVGNRTAAEVNRRCGMVPRAARTGDDPAMVHLEMSRDDWERVKYDPP